MSCEARNVALQAAGILLREEALGDDDVDVNGQADGAEGDAQHERLVAQHPAEAAGVAVVQPVEKALAGAVHPVVLCRCVRLENLAHIIGVVVSETTMEMATATLRVTANSRKRRPTMPPISRMGMNTAISDVLIDSTVKPISCEPFSAASSGRHPLLEVAGDVFDHHDGIVHDETGGDRQRHQREVIHRVAQQIHHAERADQRQRHGNAGNGGGPDAAEENENHQDHQHHGDDQRHFDIFHRGANRDGAVLRHIESGSTAEWKPAEAAAARGRDPRFR